MSLSLGDFVALFALALALVLWALAPTPALRIIAIVAACTILVFLLCAMLPPLKTWPWGPKALLIAGGAAVAAAIAWGTMAFPSSTTGGAHGDASFQPRLVANITGSGLVKPVPEKGKTLILLPVEVSNAGTPTILTHWIVVIAIGGAEIKAETIVPPPELTAEFKHATVRLKPEQFIMNATGTEPIPTGGRRAGYILAEFDRVIDDFSPYERTIKVTFRDASGALHETLPTHRIDNKSFALPQGIFK